VKTIYRQLKSTRILTALCLVLLIRAAPAAAQENEDCLACHGETDFTVENEKGEAVSFYVDQELFSGSSHGEFSCTDCHSDLDPLDHPGGEVPVIKVDCASCHEDVSEVYQASIHGQLLEMGDREVPDCSGCHGDHDIFPSRDRRSSVNKFNLMYTCARCHQNEELQKQREFGRPDAIPLFYESVHAKGLLKDGLIVAPSCNDCHGSHEIQVASSPASPIYKSKVYKTCGKCHTKVEEVYRESIHGQLVEQGDKRGPVCTDCHESHRIISPETLRFKQYSDQRCGGCHEEMLERYHETFHGKAMVLGATDVAACFDCHGHHDIVRTSDPRSQIHPDNKIATCSKCHENANPNFTNYIAHADHFDRKNYPQLFYTFILMTILLISVFSFFGLHTLLWVIRSLALFFRDSKTFREAKIKVRKDELVYRRFAPLERFFHILLIISFTTLALTGLPLKFFYADWAKMLIRLFGGVGNAGYLHRFAALTLFVVFIIHVINLIKGFIPRLKAARDPDSGKFSLKAFVDYLFRPDSLIPNWRDVKDFWDHQKWFFGRGDKPKFDRWTYWEKFDYFAVFWGVLIIGLSGLVMWFPNFFTLFLPGWIINVALIIHSDEALLAAGFIFTFHFFNVHFRIEKFPMDTVIFSGKISMAELKEERSGWLERLETRGELDQLKVGDEWEGWRPIVKTFGFIAFGLGLVLAGAIFIVMVLRLLEP
jgi:predicted CXXCH cytochrome family protein